MKTTMQAKMNW